MVNNEDTSPRPLSIRLEQKMIDRIDKMAERLSKKNYGSPFHRTDVIRAAIEKGLAVLEKDLVGQKQK